MAKTQQGRGRTAAGSAHRSAALKQSAAERLTSPAVVVVPVKQLPHGKGLPLPAYQSAGAAGLDLLAALPDGKAVSLKPGRFRLIPTALSIELPAGYEAQVRPRSGLAAKHGVTVLNAPGTIDSDYRGEIQVALVNHGREKLKINHGDRIAQLVVAPVVQVALVEMGELGLSERGTGGFGSTGTAKPKKAKSAKR
jgi:dUTP pyrophosphatase